MWRRLLFFSFAATLIGITFWLIPEGNPLKIPKIYTIPLLESKSIEGTPENPQARADYMNRMLVSPRLGRVPENIRVRELEYSQSLTRSNQLFPGARTFEINNWNLRGPINVGGRTRGAAIDVTNEDLLVAGGVSGGIWRSSEGGDNWTRITEPSALHSVSTLVQDQRPGRTDNWYYGTGELVGNTARAGGAPFRGDGILKSVDGAINWGILPGTSTSQPGQFDNQYNYVWKLAIDQNSIARSVVYAAIFGAIARTSDGGLSWEIVLGSDFGFGGNINNEIGSFHTDVAVTSDGIVYATLSEFSNSPNNFSSPDRGLYRSSDQGNTWEEITPIGWPANYRRTVIGVSPSSPRSVYFLVDSDTGGIWKLEDDPVLNITSWEKRTSNIPAFGGSVGDFDSQNSYNMVVAVHPTNPDIVFIGGTNIYRSTDGFETTENTDWIGGYSTINDNSLYPGHHPDQHSIQFYSSNPNRVLSSHDGGLSITENIVADSVIWRKINNGYITSQFYTVAMDESSNNDIVFGGMQDNGTYLTLSGDASAPWSRITGGDGAYTEISRDALYYYVSFQNSQIFRLTFDESFSLTSFARVDPLGAGQSPNQEYLFINPFVLDPNNSNIMYLAGGDKVWRNRNLSQIPSGSNEPTTVNWLSLDDTELSSGQVTALDVSTTPKDIVYFGSSGRRLYKIENAASPEPLVTELTDFAQFPVNAYVSSIAVDPTNGANLLVAFSNYEVQSLYYSTDFGETFVPVGGTLEEFPNGSGNGPSVRWVKIIPLENNEYVYLAGTSTGLYSTNQLDGDNTDWIQESPNEIGNKVVSMIKYRSTDGKILVATHGSGIYEATMNNTLPIEKDFGNLDLAIGKPFPNPFQNIINIPYSIPENEIIQAEIVNMLGQPIRNLFLGTHLSGANVMSWDGKNNAGVDVPDGVYIASILFREERVSQRIVLTRTK